MKGLDSDYRGGLRVKQAMCKHNQHRHVNVNQKEEQTVGASTAMRRHQDIDTRYSHKTPNRLDGKQMNSLQVQIKAAGSYRMKK